MTDTPKLADLAAKLTATQERILRDHDHARQIGDGKVRDEVEAYIKELERLAEALAAQIAELKAGRIPTLPAGEPDIAALKPPTEPDSEA